MNNEDQLYFYYLENFKPTQKQREQYNEPLHKYTQHNYILRKKIAGKRTCEI